MNIQSIPKVELHLHLDCCLGYEAIAKLNPAISREEYRQNFIAPEKCSNLTDYLRYPTRSVELLQSVSSLQLAVDDLFEQLQRDNVIYAEIRFAPLLHLQKGLTPEKVVTTVEQATEAAISRTRIEAYLILCTLRHFSEEQSLETVRLISRFAGSRVVAFDIAGDEASYPLTNHLAAYEYALKNKIPFTAHAGEASGPKSVWETLHNLKPSRLGHGVRSIEDPELIEYLKANDIHLEVCPSCNIQTNVVEIYADHPIEKLLRQGVSVSINTDTRTVTDITLNQEYSKLSTTFAWKTDDFLQCNSNAIKASFAPEAVKRQVLDRLCAPTN